MGVVVKWKNAYWRSKLISPDIISRKIITNLLVRETLYPKRAKSGEPKLENGRQEFLENLINEFI